MTTEEKKTMGEQQGSAVLGAQSAARGACPSDELLVAYLTPVSDSWPSGLPATERSLIEDHLGTCDNCVRALAVMQRRLGVASEVPTPAPMPLVERAAAALVRGASSPETPQPSRLSTDGTLRTWFDSVRDRLSAILRLPVLVPVAVAAVALLVVARQLSWLSPTPPAETSRDLQRREILRVTTSEALVRTQPAVRQPIVATLKRGDKVEFIEEAGDWYRVVLPDGGEGWVERRVFE